MKHALCLGVLWSATAMASVGKMPLAMLAQFADVILIGTGQPPRGTGEMASLRVERVIKGKPDKVLGIGWGDPDFLCDISALKAGERALFFLLRAKAGYELMDAGRGKLWLSADSKTVLVEESQFQITEKLAASCLVGACPLDAVLEEINPYLSAKKVPTAFFVHNRRLSSAVPVSAVACAARDGQLLTGCQLQDAGPDPKLESIAEILCMETADGGTGCLGWSPP